MKKMIILAFTMALMIPVFNSCVEVNTDATSCYTITCSEDLLELCDLTIIYKDAKGDTVKEKITDTKWLKIVERDQLPANIWFDFDLQLKPGVKLTKKTYNLHATFHLFNADTRFSSFGNICSSEAVKREDVKAFIDGINNSKKGTAIAFNYGIDQIEVIESGWKAIELSLNGYSIFGDYYIGEVPAEVPAEVLQEELPVEEVVVDDPQ